jgi:FkbM family methyltransferase
MPGRFGSVGLRPHVPRLPPHALSHSLPPDPCEINHIRGNISHNLPNSKGKLFFISCARMRIKSGILWKALRVGTALEGVVANVVKILNMPEYLYQPRAGFRRLFGRQAHTGTKIVELRWGLPFEVDLGESIGRAVAHHGLFEIAAVESIFRLVDASDIFLDIGANIGFMSAVALSAGAREIHSFEPHPTLFDRLAHNIALWEKARPEIAGRVKCHQAAISKEAGRMTLHIPLGFDSNMGTSSLEASAGDDSGLNFEVRTMSIDEIIGDRSIGVLKIDVEGHELQALAGCQRSLEARRVRDIIFEDHEGMTSEVSQQLSRAGFTLFGLNKTPFRPVLLDTEKQVERFRSLSNEALNFLATLDPARARRRMAQWGYKCLA